MTLLKTWLAFHVLKEWKRHILKCPQDFMWHHQTVTMVNN